MCRVASGNRGWSTDEPVYTAKLSATITTTVAVFKPLTATNRCVVPRRILRTLLSNCISEVKKLKTSIRTRSRLKTSLLDPRIYPLCTVREVVPTIAKHPPANGYYPKCLHRLKGPQSSLLNKNPVRNIMLITCRYFAQKRLQIDSKKYLFYFAANLAICLLSGLELYTH